MISLPLCWNGQVSVESTQHDTPTENDLTNYIAESILQEEALSADVHTNTVHFKVGWCRPRYSWKLLGAISSGLISITTEDDIIRINYKLWFNHVVIFATLAVTLASITMPDKIIYYPIGWLLLVGGNILITAWRFRSFITTCVEESRQLYSMQKAILKSNKNETDNV